MNHLIPTLNIRPQNKRWIHLRGQSHLILFSPRFTTDEPWHGTVKNRGFVETQVLMPAPPNYPWQVHSSPKDWSLPVGVTGRQKQTRHSVGGGGRSSKHERLLYGTMGLSIGSPLPPCPRVSAGVGQRYWGQRDDHFNNPTLQQKGCPSFQCQTPSAWSRVM